MPRTCTKQFTLHVEPAPAGCFTNQTNVAGAVGFEAIAASTVLNPNACFGWNPVIPAARKYDLTTRTLVGSSAPSTYPGALTLNCGAFATANNSIYLGGYDAGLANESAFVRWGGDSLLELAIIFFGGGMMTTPFGAVYAPDQNAIYCITYDVGLNTYYLTRLDCGTDTIGHTVLVNAAGQFSCRQVAYKQSNSRTYNPITDQVGAATRIEERDAAGALTNTLGGAGFYGNHNFFGCVYCSSNDRLYILSLKGAPDFADFVICVNPTTGVVEAEIGPIVIGAGATLGRLLSYDPDNDLVYPSVRPLLAIDPSSNTIACTYGAITVGFFSTAPGDNEVAVPNNPVANLGILHT